MENTTTPRTLKADPGALVANDRKADRNTRTLRILSDTEAALVVPQKFLDDGFQLAEYSGTGYRMFFRVLPTSRLVRNWSNTSANDVAMFEVDTVAHEDGSIWAEPGKAHQYGLVRTDRIQVR